MVLIGQGSLVMLLNLDLMKACLLPYDLTLFFCIFIVFQTQNFPILSLRGNVKIVRVC
jgi:hypothetical protein